MSQEGKVDCGRRRLIVATAAVGGAGMVTAMVPFLSSMLPSERAKAAGAPVEVDVGNLAPGQLMTVEWRGKPVWIFNRSPEMLETLPKLESAVADPKSEVKQQPEYCKNATRSIKPNMLVAIGICTHLGCSPSSKFKKGAEDGMPADWQGGFLCPCHGSTFDFAGRVFKSKPAPTNLEIPPHTYLSDTRILIGEDRKGA
ncbi:ubiquinol-cytochrome c reductase iron-sulfur subunit [Propionivibrio dicarboxylicus]|uniref:Ubiquinol-cytochrome c reductase iron-sulfur subunit n=1 Tax=Propionivibrio dicarboxylicus TaxID=83767 RepID=A0A1G7Y0E5_9RHOO|nr:ubiquinol-cytochrome c reductase iron-sulfur subunit [Propionivibrio dicarboxylicus]SDG89861.1 ubiquinol-cytochrome c reductase iron-sulfur subunit [Propionivibrio dicarboxylicus]